MASAQTGQSVQYKTYLIALSATFLLGALPFVVFYWFLVAAGEHYKVDRVVAHQSKHGGLYGTAIHNSERSYKLAILEKTTPRIAVIGSSRVLQFRGEFFDSSFANLGRMLLSAQTARRTFSEVMKTGHPDILIVGVDYWWFSGGYTAPDRGSRDNGGWMEPASSVTVFRWLRDGKLKADRMVEVLMTRQRNIGVLAVLNQDGYDPYGARIRTSLATGKASSADARFGLSISAMETGRGNFPHGETFDETAWIEFVRRLAGDRSAEYRDHRLSAPDRTDDTADDEARYEFRIREYPERPRSQPAVAGVRFHEPGRRRRNRLRILRFRSCGRRSLRANGARNGEIAPTPCRPSRRESNGADRRNVQGTGQLAAVGRRCARSRFSGLGMFERKMKTPLANPVRRREAPKSSPGGSEC